MSWFLLNRNLTLLEPYDWKLSCTVLRGERGSNAPDLPGKAIASPLMAEYIKFMYKTARKFWASVGVVTQEIQDIIGSEIVKEAIINNSDVVMLLDQSKFRERFDTIKAILECYMTYTTERAEKEALKLYKAELQCSHKEAIERYCADWDASGISKSLPFAQKVNAAGKVLNLHQPKTKQQ